MNLTDHAFLLGKLLANLQGLELSLRFFHHGNKPLGISDGTDICSDPIGSQLPENEFTNYDTLGKLIDRYNRQMKISERPLIELGLVDLRDALAHGRIFGNQPGKPFRLLKFSKPEKGFVRVTFNATLSREWFETQILRMKNAMDLVANNLDAESIPEIPESDGSDVP